MHKIELPYFDDRHAKIEMIVIHCLAHDVAGALESFRRHEVSAHYLIAPHGQIYALVPEEKCAWHAGKSYWRGRESLNHCSIGIEICSQSMGQEAYDRRQISALIRLCKKIRHRYHILPQNILGHSDIAPTRKADPGKAFPWAYLARHGIGRWFKLNDAQNICQTDTITLLSQIGYDTQNLAAALTAFCRHYIPDLIKTNHDIYHLLNNPFEADFAPDEKKIRQTLQAVAAATAKCVNNQIRRPWHAIPLRQKKII